VTSELGDVVLCTWLTVEVTDATELKANYVAELVFEPTQQLVVEKYADSEGLGRVGLLEGNTLVMLGKVTNVVFRE